MGVFKLGFLFLYGCRLGFWYEILAKGLLVCRFLSYSHIFHYYYFMLLCFVKFCKGASGLLGESARIRCLTTEKKTGDVFTFGSIWDCEILVITGIFCTGSFLHLGGNGLLVSFFSVSIFFLFLSKNPPPCSCSGSCYGSYTQCYVLPFLFLVFYFCICSCMVYMITFLSLFFASSLFFVKYYLHYFCFVNRNERLHEGKETLFNIQTTFTFCKYYLGLASTVQMPGEFRPILIWTTNVVTSSDEGQLVLPNRK